MPSASATTSTSSSNSMGPPLATKIEFTRRLNSVESSPFKDSSYISTPEFRSSIASSDGKNWLPETEYATEYCSRQISKPQIQLRSLAFQSANDDFLLRRYLSLALSE